MPDPSPEERASWLPLIPPSHDRPSGPPPFVRRLADDTSDEADGVLHTELDGSELNQIEPASTPVCAVVELLKQGDDVLKVGLVERCKGIGLSAF